MGRDIKVGMVVTAKDDTKAGMDSVAASAEKLDKKLEQRLEGRFGQVAIAAGGVGVAIAAANQAIGALTQAAVASITPLSSAEDHIGGIRSALLALKDSEGAKELDGIAGSIARAMYVAYSAVDTSIAQAQADDAKYAAQVAEHARQVNALAAVAADEAERRFAAESAYGDQAQKNREILRKINQDVADSRKKQQDEWQSIVGVMTDMRRQHDEEEARREEQAMARDQAYGQRVGATMQASFGEWSDYYARKADMMEADAKYQQELDMEGQRRIAEVATSLASIWGEAFGSMAASSEDAGTAIARAMVRSAQVAVMAAASSSAAQAAFAEAGIPIIGPALAVAAASMVFAVVEGYMSRIPTASQGRKYEGGVANQDSIYARVMPGELTLTKEETRIYEMGGGSGAGVVVQLSMPTQTTFPDEAALARHLNKVVGPTLQRLFANGNIRVPATAVVR